MDGNSLPKLDIHLAEAVNLSPPKPGLHSQAPVWLSHVVPTEPCHVTRVMFDSL